jgi:hypothetical protein
MAIATVIDHFAPRGLIEAAKAEWPKSDWGGWICYPGSGKMATKLPCGLPRSIEILHNEMAKLDLNGTFPDLDWMNGAGIHQMEAGVSLGLHLDTEYFPNKPWKREWSVVLYLDDDCGGNFEITDSEGNVLEEIESKSNRLAYFPTPGTWHRIQKATALRRSIVLFFWSLMESMPESGERRALFVDEKTR